MALADDANVQRCLAQGQEPAGDERLLQEIEKRVRTQTDKTTPRVLHIHNRDWPVFWLAFILVCPCLPVQCTVAFEQSRQAYSSGGCAGLARDCISRVTGFPFHPPADKQEDTIHVAGGFYSDCLFVSIHDDGHVSM